MHAAFINTLEIKTKKNKQNQNKNNNCSKRLKIGQILPPGNSTVAIKGLIRLAFPC